MLYSRAQLAIMGLHVGGKNMLESPLESWEPLTDLDRLRLIGALGIGLLRSDDIDPQGLALLLKLSEPEAQLWVQR